MNVTGTSTPKSSADRTSGIISSPRWLNLPDIAFTGKAGSGKTTAAQHLEWGNGYSRVSFAAPLKRIAGILWGTPGESDRDKLQKLGVAAREIDEDVWVNLALRTIQWIRKGNVVVDQVGGEPYRFVNDDCRFPNEYWKLKEEGFVIINVEAPQELRIDRLQRNGKLQDIAQLSHESETSLDDLVPDYAVTNDGSLEKLRTRLDRILTKEAAKR